MSISGYVGRGLFFVQLTPGKPPGVRQLFHTGLAQDIDLDWAGDRGWHGHRKDPCKP